MTEMKDKQQKFRKNHQNAQTASKLKKTHRNDLVEKVKGHSK